MKFTTLLMCLALAGCAAKTPVIASVSDASKKLHSVVLRWDPSSSFVAGQHEYRLYRGSPNCNNAAVYVSGLSDTNYVDNKVSHKTTYCYQVSVYDKANKNENRGLQLAVVTIP